MINENNEILHFVQNDRNEREFWSVEACLCVVKKERLLRRTKSKEEALAMTQTSRRVNEWIDEWVKN